MALNTVKSSSAFEKSKKVLVGGVNSPVRAFKSVGGTPIFIQKGKGAKVWDIDGNEFIDYVCSWGPLLFGHAPDFIERAISSALKNGSSFGAPTLGEIELAERICYMIPSMESVRLVNSGTEATMSALRLARAHTKRDKVIKFEGCYHGHSDSFLIKAGSGALSLGEPNSPGVTAGTAADTLLAEYNKLSSVEALFTEHKDEIAAIIVEPIAGNMGLVPPQEGFLQGLRDLCDANNSLLIFDEVISGFRLGAGGAQEKYNIKPDLSTLGKIIGGGLPVGAYGGRKEIMNLLSPNGAVYQAGTLSGNPLAVAGGIAMLSQIQNSPDLYSKLDDLAKRLVRGISSNLKEKSIPHIAHQVGSCMCFFFTKAESVNSFKDVETTDTEFYKKYFHANLEQGIYLPPSAFETFFVSDAHDNSTIDFTIEKNKKALANL